jgi:hypothetical protein
MIAPKCPSCGSTETLASIIGLGEKIQVSSQRAAGQLNQATASHLLDKIQEERFELVARRLGGNDRSLVTLKQILVGSLLKDQDICANCGVVFFPGIKILKDQAERFRDEMRKKHLLDSLIVETTQEEPE